jgi:hypothetical protein
LFPVLPLPTLLLCLASTLKNLYHSHHTAVRQPHTHIYIHTHTHTHTHTHIHTHTHTHTHPHTHTHSRRSNPTTLNLDPPHSDRDERASVHREPCTPGRHQHEEVQPSGERSTDGIACGWTGGWGVLRAAPGRLPSEHRHVCIRFPCVCSPVYRCSPLTTICVSFSLGCMWHNQRVLLLTSSSLPLPPRVCVFARFVTPVQFLSSCHRPHTHTHTPIRERSSTQPTNRAGRSVVLPDSTFSVPRQRGSFATHHRDVSSLSRGEGAPAPAGEHRAQSTDERREANLQQAVEQRQRIGAMGGAEGAASMGSRLVYANTLSPQHARRTQESSGSGSGSGSGPETVMYQQRDTRNGSTPTSVRPPCALSPRGVADLPGTTRELDANIILGNATWEGWVYLVSVGRRVPGLRAGEGASETEAAKHRSLVGFSAPSARSANHIRSTHNYTQFWPLFNQVCVRLCV